MTISAIIMMIVALSIVWGGLIASLIYLHAHPDDENEKS
ncbi:methionine/alanine import family NSS transporter small subunit [Hoyosella rhizosphaerae]|nr:methionine/alanine import family NSS transporter small subunit [Hoyosella rhizosphaerae]MBN4925635.1 methionine/alanine import family NSS transporter small subunit [Hoyosella rhizosphaerae]